MKSNTINSQVRENPRKWDWKSYFSFLAIGISVFVLSIAGFSKIVLFCASALGVASFIYFGFSSHRWALAGFFATLGLAAIISLVFLPQSDIPFGSDKMVSMFLGTVTGKIAFMAYLGKSNSSDKI